MADLQQQLQAILSDPEAMGQITALAGALSGSAPEEGPSEETPAQPEADHPPDLGNLLSVLGLDGAAGPDPAMVSAAMTLLSAYNTPNPKRTALLDALKPFLDDTRRERLDRAERAGRLARVLRTALDLWREGQSHV